MSSFTTGERFCVKCKHCEQRWNANGEADHRCSLFRDKVTGEPKTCYEARSYYSCRMCGEYGQYFETSEGTVDE